MDRRSFIAWLATLGASAAGAPGVRGQAPRMRRIGYLAVRSRSTPANPDAYYDAFERGLRELGYVEGKNIAIDWRFAEGKYERLSALAAELVKANPEVLVTHSTPGALTLQRATSAIPIVFTAVGNPLELGLVQSLSRPGGNITGVANMTNEVGVKQIQLLKTVIPKLSRTAVLFNPDNTTTVVVLEKVQTAARQLGIEVTPVAARRSEELLQALSQMPRGRAEALIVAADSLFVAHRLQIVDAAAKSRLPSIFPFAEDAAAGGTMSYGANQIEVYRRGAVYVDKILKGAKAAELPVEQPTQFEFVLNVKAASAIGLSFSDAVLSRADRVIR